MARPEKLRTVFQTDKKRGFRPVGRRVATLETEVLRLDELEALRLADLEGLYQEASAEQMHISRPTFSRILSRARTTVARAIFKERLLVIGDGPVVTGPGTPLPCAIHGREQRQGRECSCGYSNESPAPRNQNHKEEQDKW